MYLGDFSCAASSHGNVDCWGAADRGQLGRPAEPHGDARPRYVRQGRGVVEIVAGQAFACVRRRAGDVICWGDSDASLADVEDVGYAYSVAGRQGIQIGGEMTRAVFIGS
jgi:hypothetical protein